MSRTFRHGALAGAGLSLVLAAGAITVACGSGDTAGAAARGGADAAGGTGAKLVVSDPYIPVPAVAGGMGAGYLTVRNDGGDADQLLGVSSPAAGSVTLHRSSETTMQEVGSLPVPAHGTLQLARGGTHLMIMGWQRPPTVGDELELDLTFAKSGTISVKVPVKPLTYRPGS
ncbi:copper chaperone PCu(A)C [Kitasatospora sp. NPDC088346]|uniref:copper chaperone PCu(A)C n=1 Tax=Kitasatospora sp. NPDC088346 TaxID=3364073 RepID=UPI00381D7957